MADNKQQPATGDRVGSNPMNLTCKPVNSLAAESATKNGGNAPTKYALVINGKGPAAPPKNGTWTQYFVSTEAYHIKSEDGSVDFDIAAGGVAIYTK